MIILASTPDRLSLHLESRVLSAPGVWVPGCPLPAASLGALVSTPLGPRTRGHPPQARPGALLWSPAAEPANRYRRHLARHRHSVPFVFTLAPGEPADLPDVVEALEGTDTAAYLLWDATPVSVAALRRAGAEAPLIAEVSCAEMQGAGRLVEAGADLLWLGPPRVGKDRTPLWGPATLPFLLAALEDEGQSVGVPLIAGCGVASSGDALRVREAGAEVVALDPTWWARPELASEVATALADRQ